MDTSFKMQKFAANQRWITFNTNEADYLIRKTNGGIIFWSWGCEKRINFADKVLFIKVNGRYYKFWVAVTLEASDTYTVTFFKRDFTVKAQITEVYCDQLVEVIDDAVETRSDYLKDCAKNYAE